jgi:hypothetical protein
LTTGYTATARALDESAISRLAKTSIKIDEDFALYRGIRNMLRCDGAEVVHGIADYVIAQHRALKLLSSIIERSRRGSVPGLVASIGWLRAFFSVCSSRESEGYAWIARLSNERSAIGAMRKLARDECWSELKFGLVPDGLGWKVLLRTFAPRGLFKLVRRLHRRHEFFKILRVVEFLAFYTRYLEIFQRGRFKIAVTSNHSNPHGLAFNLAARKCGLPVVLITHGMPVRPVARLSYDLAIVHCDAARRSYFEEGCGLGQVLTHGRRQHYRPMPDKLPSRSIVVGIFLCKEVNAKRLKALVAGLLNCSDVSTILIRPHPKNLWVGLNGWIADQDRSRVRLAKGATVFQDVESVDVALAGNSSVLVDALTAGRPSAYVDGLDHGPSDLHRFAECGLVYVLSDTMNDGQWNFAPLLAFYQRRGWMNILRQFANIDEDEAAVLQRGLSIMRQLANGHTHLNETQTTAINLQGLKDRP